MPEDGYAGAYIDDIAAQVVAAEPGLLERSDDEQLQVVPRPRRRADVRRDQDAPSPSSASSSTSTSASARCTSRGALEKALARLREQGHVYESDGAVWLRTTDFGDDKDRVLVKSDGEPTYFAADCAYYLDKRERGFDKVVIMLGADHTGYVGRYKALVAAIGDDPDTNLEILIGQLVNLVRDGEPVRMSKRAGTVVTLADLVDAIGADAARYALARVLDRPADRPRPRPVEPADQRQPGLLRAVRARPDRLGAAQRRRPRAALGEPADVDVALLAHQREGDLLRALGEFPRVVAAAAELRAPHRVARYLEELAGTYHRFYDSCRVLPRGDEEATPLTTARLWLCAATAVVLRNGLAVLGVHAPERM